MWAARSILWMSTQVKLSWHKLSHFIVKQCKCSGLSSATSTHKAFVNICLTLPGRFRCIFSTSHEVPLHHLHHWSSPWWWQTHLRRNQRDKLRAAAGVSRFQKQSNAFSYPTASCALNLKKKAVTAKHYIYIYIDRVFKKRSCTMLHMNTGV